jgi:hypothetical protein
MTEYTTRFTQYARSQGRHPACQLAADEKEFPGGKMAGFQVWISQQWRAWAAATQPKGKLPDVLTPADHAAFDAWLAAKPNPVHVVKLEGASGRQFTRVRAGMREDAVTIAMGFNKWASSGQWAALATPAQVEELDRMSVDMASDLFEKRPTWADGSAA